MHTQLVSQTLSRVHSSFCPGIVNYKLQKIDPNLKGGTWPVKRDIRTHCRRHGRILIRPIEHRHDPTEPVSARMRLSSPLASLETSVYARVTIREDRCPKSTVCEATDYGPRVETWSAVIVCYPASFGLRCLPYDEFV